MPVGGKRPGAGRPKGVPNKTTATVRANVLEVFEAIGGNARMAGWAVDNLTDYYKLYARMAPSDSDAPGSKDNPLHHKVERVIIDSSTN